MSLPEANPRRQSADSSCAGRAQTADYTVALLPAALHHTALVGLADNMNQARASPPLYEALAPAGSLMAGWTITLSVPAPTWN